MAKRKKDDIWENVLLKNVEINKLKNLRTIKSSELSDRKAQIFEVLVGETMARMDAQTDWELTQLVGDGGIDFIGKRPSIPTPFLTVMPPPQVILGQIKRRGSDYRYDDFKSDITKMYEYYTSNAMFKDSSLLQLSFIVSSDKENVAQHLKERLIDEYEQRKSAMFFASIKSPIETIDAKDIIRYWRINPDFITSIVEDVLTMDELHLLLDYIRAQNPNYISVSVQRTLNGIVYTPVEMLVKLSVDIKVLDMTIKLKWRPSESSRGKVQLIMPLNLINPKSNGMTVFFRNDKTIQLFFQGLEAGELNLGGLLIYNEKDELLQSIDLGSINFSYGITNRFANSPNRWVYDELAREMHTGQMSLFAALGSGGIGKSTIINTFNTMLVNNGYFSIQIKYPNDTYNSRNVIISLITAFIKSPKDKSYSVDFIISKIKEYLGSAYLHKWDEDLRNFIQEDDNYSHTSISDCLATLIIVSLNEGPLFLHISDMHWLNKECGDILTSLVNTLQVSADYINNKLIMVFEGRDKEYILLNSVLVPCHAWERFYADSEIKKLILKPWTEVHSKEFIESILRSLCSYDASSQLVNHILAMSKGNPLHILEQIRYLFDKGKLTHDQAGNVYIVDYEWAGCFSDELRAMISQRITYYKRTCPQMVELLAITSQIDKQVSISFYDYMLSELDDADVQLRNNIQQSGFINENIYKGTVSFAHEFYWQSFKEIKGLDSHSIELAVKWISRSAYLDELQILQQIKLKLLQRDFNILAILDEINDAIHIAKQDRIKLELWLLLLPFPDAILNNKNLSRLYIMFEIAEINIRLGSWDFSKEFLLEIVNSKYNESSDFIFILMANQELANILCEMLLFDESILVCENSIITIERAKKYGHYDSLVLAELEQMHEMILARSAVCYWFSGNLDTAFNLQSKALENAKKYGNTYMKMRILYEAGTAELHINCKGGLEKIQTALNLIEETGSPIAQERNLICVQKLIGQLLVASYTKNFELVRDIEDESSYLCAEFDKNSSNYEASLCYIINGISHILLGQNQEGLNSFIKSAIKAQKGNLINILWKSFLNIAQTYELLGSEDKSKHHARRANEILESAAQSNPKQWDCFRKLIYKPMLRINTILGKQVDSPMDSPELSGTLAVEIGENIFVIMN